MADDDREVRARMAALEAEVKADADAARARREAAMAKLRAQAAKSGAPLPNDPTAPPKSVALAKRPAPKPAIADDEDGENDDDDADVPRTRRRAAKGLGGALELADQANRVKHELTRKPTKGEKSWMVSGLVSLGLGPIGWLYAGSLRESIPAATVWVLIATLASKILPTLLLWPALMIVMPLSGIAGIVYALQYNRHGGRQRIFDKDKDGKGTPKQLPNS